MHNFCAAVILSFIASFVKKFIGYARDILIANKIGLGWQMDVFWMAMRFPFIIRKVLIDGAINAIGLLYWNELRAQSHTTINYKKYIWLLVGYCFMITVIITGIIFIILQWLGPWLLRHFDPSGLTLYYQMTIFLFIGLVVNGISGAITTLIKANKQVVIPEWLDMSQHIGIICGVISYTYTNDIVNLSCFALVAEIVRLIIVTLMAYKIIHSAKKNAPTLGASQISDNTIMVDMESPTIPITVDEAAHIVYKISNWRGFLHHILRLMAHYSISSVISLGNLIVVSYLPIGAMSAFYYADRLYQIPTGILGSIFASIILSFYTNTRNPEQHIQLLQVSLKSVFMFLPAVTAVCIFFADEVVLLIYHNITHFTWISYIFQIYAFAIPFTIIREIISAIFVTEKQYKLIIRINLYILGIYLITASLVIQQIIDLAYIVLINAIVSCCTTLFYLQYISHLKNIINNVMINLSKVLIYNLIMAWMAKLLCNYIGIFAVHTFFSAVQALLIVSGILILSNLKHWAQTLRFMRSA